MLPHSISKLVNPPLDFLDSCPIVISANSSALDLILKLKQDKPSIQADWEWLNFDQLIEDNSDFTYSSVFAVVIHKS